MKSVLAFLLLIGIFCQIGRGDCAPDTIIDDMQEMAQNGVQYVKDTYNEYFKPNMPDVPDITPDMPSVSIPDSLKEGYKNIKDGMGSMAEGIGEMAKDTMDSIADDID